MGEVFGRIKGNIISRILLSNDTLTYFLKRKILCSLILLITFQDLDMSVGNFTEVLSGVDKRVQVMRQFQQLSRGLESRDYNILLANANYVARWSLAQAAVVILCGITQVYFVRKLFESPVGGKSKIAART